MEGEELETKTEPVKKTGFIRQWLRLKMTVTAPTEEYRIACRGLGRQACGKCADAPTKDSGKDSRDRNCRDKVGPLRDQWKKEQKPKKCQGRLDIQHQEQYSCLLLLTYCCIGLEP